MAAVEWIEPRGSKSGSSVPAHGGGECCPRNYGVGGPGICGCARSRKCCDSGLRHKGRLAHYGSWCCGTGNGSLTAFLAHGGERRMGPGSTHNSNLVSGGCVG